MNEWITVMTNIVISLISNQDHLRPWVPMVGKHNLESKWYILPRGRCCQSLDAQGAEFSCCIKHMKTYTFKL